MSDAGSPGFVAPAALLAQCSALEVRAGEIQLWAFDLRGDEATIERCCQPLSNLERTRAERFVFVDHRREFVLAHGVLRHLLSRYLGDAPHAIEFDATPEGKPRLRRRSGLASGGRCGMLTFNLSHSHDRALLAVGYDREIGVDLEMERSGFDLLDLAHACFFRSEIASIRSTVGLARQSVFFRYWVAKEAVLKAQGVGLGFPLDRFEILLAPDGQSARVDSFEPERLAPDWTVRLFEIDSGWPGAVAAEGSRWHLRFMGAG